MESISLNAFFDSSRFDIHISISKQVTEFDDEFDAQDCIVRVEVELKFLHLPKVYFTKIL